MCSLVACSYYYYIDISLALAHKLPIIRELARAGLTLAQRNYVDDLYIYIELLILNNNNND